MLNLDAKAGERIFIGDAILTVESIERLNRSIKCSLTPNLTITLSLKSVLTIGNVGLRIVRFNSGTNVKIGIAAPKDVVILREKVKNRLC